MKLHPAVKAVSAVVAVWIILSAMQNGGKAMGMNGSYPTGYTGSQSTNNTYVRYGGDCGMIKYDVPESGAGSYCYVSPSNTAHGYKPAPFAEQPVIVVKVDRETAVPEAVTCTTPVNEYHPCP